MTLDRRRFLWTSSAVALAGAGGAPGLGWAGATTRADRAYPSPQLKAPGERLSLGQGWRFHLGDVPFPKIRGHGWSYANAKAGNAGGAASPEYDDSDWRELDLPHDWVVEGPFDKDENLAQGYRPRGKAWYRRALRLDPADRGKHLSIEFGAIATHATVWFNGSVVARNWSGYNALQIDITPFARYGDELNSIAVQVDADAMEGWWYEGGGIYRHVWLTRRSAVHIADNGVHADPRRDAAGRWTLPVVATLGNIGPKAEAVEVEAQLIDPWGKAVGAGRVAAEVPPLDQGEARLVLNVDDPRLWSVDDPALYTVRTRVWRAGQVVDEAVTSTGFRTLRFDADQGFFLNDRPLKIHGVCLHQDHAGVGVAVPDSLWDFRLRRVKAMGANAVRCAHNAPAPEMLDAADRLGVLILDENRNFNPSPDYMRQLEWLIRRDRNHPSVFLWSVFNEEPMQGTEAGYQMVRRMVAAVKRLDDSRPVTAAMNDGMFNPINVSQAVDVVGFNYQPDKYDRFHAEHPTLPLMSSEDTSSFMTRGEWFTDRSRNILAENDEEPASWGATHRKAWEAIAKRPFVAGAFLWSGFDYRGEPSPLAWPSASSFFGAMDLCGFPKMAFFLHRAQWIKDRPLLDLAPHWTWPGKEGQPIKVMALTNAEAVELRLNGKLISRQAVDPFVMPSWIVPYAPGRLEAIGYVGGRPVSKAIVETAGPPVSLRLTPDRTVLTGDGADAAPITVEALDKAGRAVPTANLAVTFEIDNGRIIGLGNGDPNCHEPEKGNTRSLFNGLAQVIVQTERGSSGVLRLKASAQGLRGAQTQLSVRPGARAMAPRTAPISILSDWRVSPVTRARPDPSTKPADHDMNSWTWARPGLLQDAVPEGGFVLYRATFTPRATVRRAGGKLVFGRLTGPAEVYLDGVRIATKTDAAPGALTATLPPKDGERIVAVLMAAAPGEPFGMGAEVIVAELE
ncbi:beta-galactosidase [Caulobacter sp. Root343]|nr:beta-galactosidase [Caulobacter sp. Root342]KQV69382.1 beta-galactosidase [Caulobacter sp. Root343]